MASRVMCERGRFLEISTVSDGFIVITSGTDEIRGIPVFLSPQRVEELVRELQVAARRVTGEDGTARGEAC